MLDATKIMDPYLGNDKTPEYGFNFKIFDRTHLAVSVANRDGDETSLVIDVDYTVTGVGDEQGGFITLIDDAQEWMSDDGNLETFFQLQIRHNPELIQDEDLRNQETYDPVIHERAIDKVVTQFRAIDGVVKRAIRAPETEASPLYLSPVSMRSNSLLGFSTDGEPVPTRSVIDPTGLSDYAITLVDDVSPEKARTTLGFAGPNGTIATENIEDGAITTAKFKDGAVNTIDIDNEDVMLPKVSTELIHGLTAVDADPADYAPGTDISDSNLNKKFLLAGISTAAPYRAITANHTVLTTDCFIKCTGSMDVTLYTAVGNAGREVEIYHGGTHIIEVVTLKTTSAQTIGGVASGSYKLHTTGETIRLRSDGANWLIVNHFCSTVWIEQAVDIGSSGTQPTKGSATIYIDEFWWRRVGDTMECQFDFRKTLHGSATAGTGDYLIKIPGSALIDIAKVTLNGTTEGVPINGSPSVAKKSLVGFFGGAGVGTGFYNRGAMAVFSQTGISMNFFGNTVASATIIDTVCGSHFHLAQAGADDTTYRGHFAVPISGWRK